MDKARLKELALSASKQKRKDSHPPGYRNIAESLSIEERYIAAAGPETILALLEENSEKDRAIRYLLGCFKSNVLKKPLPHHKGFLPVDEAKAIASLIGEEYTGA